MRSALRRFIDPEAKDQEQSAQGQHNPPVPDARALALILFQKFHKDLPRLEDRTNTRRIREIIIEAINLLPAFAARVDEERENLIHLRRADGLEASLNVQDTIDSIRTVWNEYQSHFEDELEISDF